MLLWTTALLCLVDIGKDTHHLNGDGKVGACKDLLIHVTPQHSLKSLGLEAALHNEAALPVKRPAGSQLCQQELLHMLWLPIHALVELHEICEDCFLGTFTCHLHDEQGFDRLLLDRI